MKKIRIATRKSELALWQAKHVGSLLSQSDNELDVEIVGYTTEGDIRRHERLQDLGGKGLFTQELERGLLEKHVDFAVHSMKDVPANLDELFGVVAAGERADVRDALVGADSILALPKGSRVGSSSGRRAAQLVRQNRDLDIVPVRGNVGTRLEKLRRGEFDALLLACAGLDRLGLSSEVGQRLDIDFCVPAAGQGALAVEFLKERKDIAAIAASLCIDSVAMAVESERLVVKRLGADCTTPLGVYCRPLDPGYHVTAVLLTEAGDRCLRVEKKGEDGAALAEDAAETLLAMGARELIDVG